MKVARKARVDSYTNRITTNPDKPEISALTVVCNILGALFFFGIPGFCDRI